MTNEWRLRSWHGSGVRWRNAFAMREAVLGVVEGSCLVGP